MYSIHEITPKASLDFINCQETSIQFMGFLCNQKVTDKSDGSPQSPSTAFMLSTLSSLSRTKLMVRKVDFWLNTSFTLQPVLPSAMSSLRSELRVEDGPNGAKSKGLQPNHLFLIDFYSCWGSPIFFRKSSSRAIS
jgi:hypothetical protein